MKNSTYNIYLAAPNVVIALDGYDPVPEEGFEKIGSFEHGADPLNSQTSAQGLTADNGDHVFVAKAKEILSDHLGRDLKHNEFVFQDRASNAPNHEEENYSTDALPTVDEGHDPDVSSQAGGVSTTDPDETDEERAARTDPNGVTESEERTDEGDDTVQTPAEPESERRNDDVKGFQDVTTNEATGNQEDSEETEEAEETEETGSKSNETIPQLTERLAGINDKTELEKIYADEQAGQNRSGAIKAIEARAAELA
jgi:hypothetical protein